MNSINADGLINFRVGARRDIKLYHNNIDKISFMEYYISMYKKTAKSKARKLLKSHNYMPTLNIISDRGLGSQWYKKAKKKKIKHTSTTLFG